VVSRDERPLSRFVGRERELATLEEVFAQVEAGHGQVVGIVAEAGGGKSRLLYEFRQRVAETRVTYLEGRCLSYGSRIPYHPILDVVRQNCGITERDTAATVLDKVRFALHEVGMDAAAAAPYLLHMLGVHEGTDPIAVLTPEALKTRTFETLRQMSLAGSQRRPLLLAVEDLHWVDTTSEAYLALLVESLAGAAIMLLTTYRPGYRPPWLDKSYATQLALRSLAPPEALTVVRTTRPDAALPAHLEQTIVEKAEGNPFFLEELTRAVLERSAPQSVRSVPDTIQGVLSARIDRLPEDHKRLVQSAAVLGREFSRRLLEAIWDGGAVDPLLVELQRLEFLYERTGAEEPTYVFKHALTQEVAYDSLLTTRRQALHAAAGHALEQRYADRLDEVADRLAYHYARTDNTAKAVEYLTRVAERAARGFAHTEALTALEEALVHAERLPSEARDQRVVELWTRQLESLHWAGRRQEAIALHRERQARVDRIEDHALVGRYYVWLIAHYMFLGERNQAVQSAQRALAEARQCQDDVLMGMAYAWLGSEDYFAGRLLQAVEHGQRTVELLERTTERYWLGTANYVLAYSYAFIGEFGQALEAATRAEAIADTIGDRRLQTNAAAARGWSLMMRGDWEAGITACQDALERAPDPFETALALGLLGCAYLEQGNRAAAIPVLEQAVEEAIRYRSRQVQISVITYLGEAYRLDQQLDKAQQLASQGYELASSIRHSGGAALAQRTLGRLAHTRGNLAEAEALLQEALDTFASIHARFEAGRTHLDLAALAHTQGNQTGATAHLTQAQALFAALQVPRYVERTTHLARAYGITLHAGAPAAPTEG
jgi:tetratricopeptide (TPR) repeat protein